MSSNIFFQSLETNKSRGLLFFMLILTALTYLRFQNVVHNLGNQQVLEAWGDGLKTYTNAIYHIDHDAENHWFGGMNYPYGEHIIPATELPGLPMLMKSLKGIFPNISDYVVPAIHLEIMLAFLLCGLFLFLIFRELKLPFWYSTLAAIGLTFLNPLFPRFNCHFGLAQPFIIPLILYLLLLFEKKPSFKISFLIGLSVFLASFLHFYFFGINVFIISFYFFFRLFNQPKNTAISTDSFFKKMLQYPPVEYAIQMIPHYFLMVVTTLIFFYVWMIGKDPVLDRSPNPYGFLVYISNWEGIFLWDGNPLLALIKKQFRETQFEGRAYIGMVALVFLIGAIFNWLKSGFKRFFITENKQASTFFKAAFGSSTVLLAIAMAIPFVYSSMEFLMDYAGPLRQFRSLGRFAWVFFYAINIIAFCSIYYYLKDKSKTVKSVTFLLMFSCLFFEAYQFTNRTELKLAKVAHWEKGNQFSELESIDFSQYQATVPVPYFSVGSNNFNNHTSGYIPQRSQTIAIQTGVPTTGAMLTRSSFRQTVNHWQMLLETYRSPAIFQDFKNEKPLLLLWRNTDNSNYHPTYGHLKEGATSVYKEGELEMFHVELANFDNRIKAKKQAIANTLQQDSLFKIKNFRSTDSLENFVFQNYASLSADKAYLDGGAFTAKLNIENVVFSDTLPNVQKDSLYQVQAWVWMNEDKMPASKFTLIEEDAAGAILQKQVFHLWPNIRTFDPNGWALLNYQFRPKAVGSRFKISFTGEQPRDERTQYFDELLIKPVETHLYKETDKFIWMDNLWFER